MKNIAITILTIIIIISNISNVDAKSRTRRTTQNQAFQRLKAQRAQKQEQTRKANRTPQQIFDEEGYIYKRVMINEKAYGISELINGDLGYYTGKFRVSQILSKNVIMGYFKQGYYYEETQCIIVLPNELSTEGITDDSTFSIKTSKTIKAITRIGTFTYTTVLGAQKTIAKFRAVTYPEIRQYTYKDYKTQ